MGKQTGAGDGEPLQALNVSLQRRRVRIQERVLSWASSHSPRYVWRCPGGTPYGVLIGELCLKETSPTLAPSLYEAFLRRFPTIRALAEAADADLTDLLSGFHLQHYAPRLKKSADGLLREGKGSLPRDSRVFIRALGLEHCHARAIMCFGYGLPISVVDGNVERMLSRVFAASLPPQPPPGLIHTIGEVLLPACEPCRYDRALLEIAESLCLPEDPVCSRCPLGEDCDYDSSCPQQRSAAVA